MSLTVQNSTVTDRWRMLLKVVIMYNNVEDLMRVQYSTVLSTGPLWCLLSFGWA